MTKTNFIHYESTISYKSIYIFCVHDDSHRNILKIGDASVDSNLLPDLLLPNSSILNQAAKARINQYSVTLGITPHLLHTEIAVRTVKDENGNEFLDSFRDYDVHKVLLNSGIEKVRPNNTNANEWFSTDLETAKNAIKAVKEGRKSLFGNEITETNKTEIILREEQEDAIHKTVDVFKISDQMLWNAKMRYGKTVTALSFVKRNLEKYQKTLIITHRPVVQSGWRDDFNLIFKNGECTFEKKEYETDNPEESEKIDYANELHLKQLIKCGQPFIYFASIQDLRGSKQVGGRFNKNNAVFNMEWDLIINDEAHEGTQTQLGQNVAAAIKKKHTKLLSLSGTPFNIMYQYDDEAVYTWDYVMEQARKLEWDKTHPGDPNPYASLPQMHIYTYDLGDIIRGYSPELEGKAFNFSEFFRTWTGDPQKDGKDISADSIGEFIHKLDIEKFLNMISTASEDSAYPFATEEYRDMFRHTLWMVPGVKEAKALSKLLRDHQIFGHGNFGIANVAGEGDEYEETYAQDALDLVKKTIKENDYSITLSCGKLTTGVTIKEWTACFMLSGSYMTGAANYLQTIFRVQSPGSVRGKAKEHCYVFDFAPDRTLRVVAEAAKVSRKGGTGGTGSDEERRLIMAQFLNFCPVIAISGTSMRSYSVDNMMQQIKHIYAERAINSGFEDSSIYNERMMALDKLDLKDFEELKEIIGSTKANKSAGELPVNEQGFTEEEFEKLQQLKKKNKRVITEDEKVELEKLKKQKEEKSKAEAILRGVSVRMPLLIFGADVPFSEDITIEKFIDFTDDESWNEFMPKGVTKKLFSKFIKYYDKDVFVAAAKEIRLKAKRADGLLPTERVQQIALIHSKFKNPDKETVLTPWRVVNMHMSDCLGGYCFYDDTFTEDKKLEISRFVDQGGVTDNTLGNPNAKILEINSKTGLYPLYVTYSIYRAKCYAYEHLSPLNILGEKPVLTDKKQNELWAETIRENVFIICKTPMAKAITRRTLAGYSDVKVNAHYFDDLINQLKRKSEQFIKKVSKGSFWGKEVKEMKFDAIVGNPPYQVMDGGYGVSASPVYQYFVEHAKHIDPKYISMIMPAKWFSGGKYLDDFRKNMLADNHLSKLIEYSNFRDVFPSVDLAGGVCYFLWDKTHRGNCMVKNASEGDNAFVERKLDEYNVFIRSNKAVIIVHKILNQNTKHQTLDVMVSPSKPFGMRTYYEPKDFGVPCWFIQKIGRKFADPKDVVDSAGYLDKWKLLLPAAPIAGQTDFTKPVGFYYDGNTIIAKPGECCTESFIVGGAFDTEEEALAFKSYIFTKTVRFLLLQAVVSQHVTQKNFCFIPDLGHYSGRYTDKQLCAMWNIDQDEWNYIDSRIHNYEGQSEKNVKTNADNE